MDFKTLLPQRIPEYLQDDNNLKEYLEATGELFDQYKKAIDDMAYFTDYKNCPETRLRDLAREFAMEFPRNLNEDLQRAILRDLEEIYRRNGIEDVINWIFRVIGWDVELQKSWVINPERYDPDLKDIYNLDDYGGPQSEAEFSDFYRQDYRNFLIGEEHVRDNGTYFTGRKFFDLEDTYHDIEIVGEEYFEGDKKRTPDKVMPTPYLFIRVSEESYNIFTSPYEGDDGTTYDYTQSEFFLIVENILNFFLYDAFRPTHVRVVIIVTAQIFKDDIVIDSTLTDSFDVDPTDVKDDLVIDSKDTSTLNHIPLVGEYFSAGTPPSPFNKDMVITSVETKSVITDEGFRISTDEGLVINTTVSESDDRILLRCGSENFTFVTPHEESFEFRKAYINDSTGEFALVEGAVEGNPEFFEDDYQSIALAFDVTTESYGVAEEIDASGIIVRNPTTITSDQFLDSEIPDNAYMIGTEDGTGSFERNNLFSFDFRRDETTFLSDEEPKTFVYDFNTTVHKKTNNLQTGWEFYSQTPTKDQFVMISDMNTVLFVINNKIAFDLIINIKYEAQPVWRNRE